MSETMMVMLITAAILAAMFAWVPLLKVLCPPCGRALLRVRRRPVADRETAANEA